MSSRIAPCLWRLAAQRTVGAIAYACNSAQTGFGARYNASGAVAHTPAFSALSSSSLLRSGLRARPALVPDGGASQRGRRCGLRQVEPRLLTQRYRRGAAQTPPQSGRSRNFRFPSRFGALMSSSNIANLGVSFLCVKQPFSSHLSAQPHLLAACKPTGSARLWVPVPVLLLLTQPTRTWLPAPHWVQAQAHFATTQAFAAAAAANTNARIKGASHPYAAVQKMPSKGVPSVAFFYRTDDRHHSRERGGRIFHWLDVPAFWERKRVCLKKS